MKRMLLVCALVSAILVPAALAADPVPSDYKNASKYCQALRASKGLEAFRAQWGAANHPNKANAFGKCVSATNKAKAKQADDATADDDATGDDAGTGPAATCKKQRADNPATFAQTYKNLGACVKAQQAKN